jgi:hypothetical protein
MWMLQQRLMHHAELLLGRRTTAKKLYQPAFSTGGPFVRNTPNRDGAFAELSPNAAGYWPTVVFELAHETVHLLDPCTGYTNWLEEGLAVEFSHYCVCLMGGRPSPAEVRGYRDAQVLVRALPGGAFAFGKQAREKLGPLHLLTAQMLKAEFPQISKDLAKRLTKTCVPRLLPSG